MADINVEEILETLRKKLEEWKAEGVLEEKLIEHGFTFNEDTNSENLE